MKRTLYKRSIKKAPSTNGGVTAFPWGHIIVAAIILVFPFFVLYWLVPFAGKHTIGNDYLQYWIKMQLYLRFSIENGTFPLYAPGFNGGWTASALSLGQLWHPISWVAAILPGYWNGHAHAIGTLLRLFSLGGVHLVLFLFLRRLRLDITLAFVISFITTYNLRMLDMFRYGASLENYTAFLLLCVMIAWCYITPKKRLGHLCIAVSTCLLVIGGHPQMMYFGLLGAAIVCLITPFYMASLLPGEALVTLRRVRGFYLTVGIWVVIGILLASFYNLPFCFEYLQESSRGIDLSFQWACSSQDTLGGNFCNLFNPFHSDVHGAFGGSSLILLAALVPLLCFFKVRVPWIVLLLWLICVVIFVMMIGSNGPLYYYFWKYFPFAQSFRVPGRMGLILPFMLLLLLTWLARCEPLRFRICSHNVHLSPLALVATAGLLVFVFLNSLPLEVFKLDEGWVPAKINRIPSMAITLFTIMGVLSLVALIVYTMMSRFRLVAAIVLTVTVFLQIAVTLRYGTWVVSGPRKTLTFEQMRIQQQKQVGFRGTSGDWSRFAINRHLSQTFLEPTLARICPKYTVVDSLEKAYKGMAQERSVDHVFVENYPETDIKTKTKTLDGTDVDQINLKYNSFNNLRFDVTCSQPGFFVLSLPSNRWRAYINRERVPVYRANGIERAIWLKAGKNNVEFRYWSWATIVGVVISCLVLFLTLHYLMDIIQPTFLRRSAIFIMLCICIFSFIIWYHSLYWGGHLGTNYIWTSEAIQPHLSSHHNLAYGKRTSMSSTISNAPYLYAAARGVDGDRGPQYGFATDIEKDAWWQVDLGRVEHISEIILYKQGGKYNECGVPFDISASFDGSHWFLIQTITQNNLGINWRIKCRKVRARYIKLQTQRRNRLILAEVEVYGPTSASRAVPNRSAGPNALSSPDETQKSTLR